jgi:beta-mannosidase
MFSQSLNGQWYFQKTGESQAFETHVPTMLYDSLLQNGQIDDPYVGENDKMLTKISEDDYEFYREFELEAEVLLYDRIDLQFMGIDTLSTIFLNGTCIGRTNNMHCEYTFDVKCLLVVGKNKLRIALKSPTKFITEAQAKDPLWGIVNTIPGYEYLRKAHHMFGWDWGPQLPDMGIWRPVHLKAYSTGKLENCYISQTHTNNVVELHIDIEATQLSVVDHIEYGIEILGPDGEQVAFQKTASTHVTLLIQEPQLWWPNGYGEQPLYTLRIFMEYQTNRIDSLEKRIGLRTVTMTREKDGFGESFDMTVNGLRLFAMGADYIPEDILINRMSKERTYSLLDDCKMANFNHIRVWGGAFYPDDYFYDRCDELGLLVWQDFMFACGVYRLTKKFHETITLEIIQNVRRIRHHACLALWCGNNEMEVAFVEWGLPKDERLRLDYLLMYEKLIPELLEEHDPNTFYWPASPSSGGGFQDPNADDQGDVHFWQVFHGNKHYKEFRKHYFRFASEYGMQSFPDVKTIYTYAKEQEREIYGPVMENHNKCLGDINGNMKIMMNMAGEFNLPSQLEDVVYVSQVFQGETIKCAVEHFRRNRGRCMGSTYWQLNDNWPVASWSSIDFYGRWKALHYMVKRFYAPLLISAYELGTQGFIHVTNESRNEFIGIVLYQLRHVTEGILEEKSVSVSLDPCSTKEIAMVDCSNYIKNYGDERKLYISFQLLEEKIDTTKVIAADTLLFVAHKYFGFEKAVLASKIVEDKDGLVIQVTSNQFSKSVGVTFKNVDIILSDNYFDLLPTETRELRIVKVQNGAVITKEVLEQGIEIKAVNSLSYMK